MLSVVLINTKVKLKIYCHLNFSDFLSCSKFLKKNSERFVQIRFVHYCGSTIPFHTPFHTIAVYQICDRTKCGI